MWLSVLSWQTASSTYELVKWSPYVFLKFFMKILNLLTILGKKTSFICFFLFESSKFWNCWPFYPTGAMSRMHTFEKCQCDRCQHRSAVKNTPPPSPSLPVPIPPPTVPTTPAPTAQGQWYRAFWIMWSPRPMAVAPLAPVAIRSVPRPLLPSAGKTGSTE